MGHHALAVLQHFLGVAVGRAATQVGDAQVAGVDEADELGRLVVEQRVGADRVGRRGPGVGIARLDVGRFLDGGCRVAAVAIAAAQLERVLAVRVAHVLVALHAADTLGCGLLGRLLHQVDCCSSGGIGKGTVTWLLPADGRSGTAGCKSPTGEPRASSTARYNGQPSQGPLASATLPAFARFSVRADGRLPVSTVDRMPGIHTGSTGSSGSLRALHSRGLHRSSGLPSRVRQGEQRGYQPDGFRRACCGALRTTLSIAQSTESARRTED